VTCVLGARARRELLVRLVDVTVFAPIGLLAVARDHRSELSATATGSLVARVAAIRRVGDLAVAQGRREVQRRLDASSVRRTPDAATSTSAPERATGGPAPHGASVHAGVEPDTTDAGTTDTVTLPIEGYEHLAASQIVVRLAALDDDELAAVEGFERAHRNRRTIHGRIAQLRAER
jgi:hypothetical protein